MLQLNPTVRNKIISNVILNGAVCPYDYTVSMPDIYGWSSNRLNTTREKQSTQEKAFPVPLRPPQILPVLAWD
jgi:hypothetical protein